MNISKSRIKTLESCPLLFKWQYIDKRIPDIPPDPVTKIGLDIHQIFDHFYDNIDILKVPQNSYEYFVNSMKILPQYQEIYNLFCLFQSRRWQLTENKEKFMPVLREKRIVNEDEVGVIDAVHYSDGEYLLLDYKSNVSNPSNLRFELNFYKKLLDENKILDKPVKYIGSYGYKNANIFIEEINTRSYTLMLKKVEAFRKNDWQNLLYSKTPGFYCNWCQYLPSCNKL